MKKMQTHTKAFTMLELVFVIIILGILAALTLPRIERDVRQEAADNLLSAIRYTQHLALIDDKHSYKDPNWQRTLWLIRFAKFGNEWTYTIGSDIDKGGNIDNNINNREAAVDPLTGKYFYTNDATQDDNESPRIFLTKKYGITNVTFNGCKGSQQTQARHIAFDNKGRPHRGVLNTGGAGAGGAAGADNSFRTYVKNGQCEITFQSSSFSPNLKIIIREETGYAYIDGQPNS